MGEGLTAKVSRFVSGTPTSWPPSSAWSSASPSLDLEAQPDLRVITRLLSVGAAARAGDDGGGLVPPAAQIIPG